MINNFSLAETSVNSTYPNAEAHQELKAMMNRGEKITVNFYLNKDGYEVVYVESRTTQSFQYILTEAGLAWIIGYLKKGETEDFKVEPTTLTKSDETSVNSYRKNMLKAFVENKIGNIQFTPEFRDRTGKLSGIANFANGRILFFVERDEDITEYLRDKGLIR